MGDGEKERTLVGLRARLRELAVAEKEERDFSLRRPTRSQEANVKEKASACSVRNDGGVLVVRCGGHEVFQPAPIHRERVEDFAVRTNEGGVG